MKHIFFFIISVLFATTCLMSQNIAFGPDLGLNMIPVNKTDIDIRTFKLNFNGGLYGEYHISRTFSVRLGLGVSTSSKSYVKTDTASIDQSLIDQLGVVDTSVAGMVADYVNLSITKTTKGNTNFTFFRVPLTVMINAHKNFRLSLGGYADVLLKATTREEMTQDIPIIEAFQDAITQIPFGSSILKQMFPGLLEPDFSESTKTSNLNTYDYGINIGAIYQLDNNLFFKAAYSKGFVSYYKSKPDMYVVKSPYHSMFTISVGYGFGKPFTTVKVKKRYNLDLENIDGN